MPTTSLNRLSEKTGECFSFSAWSAFWASDTMHGTCRTETGRTSLVGSDWCLLPCDVMVCVARCRKTATSHAGLITWCCYLADDRNCLHHLPMCSWSAAPIRARSTYISVLLTDQIIALHTANSGCFWNKQRYLSLIGAEPL